MLSNYRVGRWKRERGGVSEGAEEQADMMACLLPQSKLMSGSRL